MKYMNWELFLSGQNDSNWILLSWKKNLGPNYEAP